MKKVICITGGGRGIGAATAKLAAKSGYAVCVAYLKNHDAAQSVVNGITAVGGEAIAVQADVSIEPDVVRLFETIDSKLGRITALVNNAAILETQTRIQGIDAARLQRVFATNV